MRRIITVLIIAGLGVVLQAQSVEIATWKNNAQAAYSIILDDLNFPFYGDLDFIHVTTSERDIPLSFAVVAKYDYHWDEARDFLQADGHDFVTHSMDHKYHENTPDTLEWTYNTSQERIEENIPGSECMFVANWNPMNKDGAMEFIKENRFIGARGWGSSSGVHDADFDPFYLNTYFYQNGKEAEIKAVVDDVIASGGFGLNTFHYVGGAVSWGYILEGPWIDHLDYVKSKSNENILWVETIQKVIKYRMEREFYQVSVVGETENSLEIAFDISNEINESPKVDNSVYDQDLTLLITTSGGLSAMINANPLEGNVEVNFDQDNILNAYQNGKQIYSASELLVDFEEIEFGYTAGEQKIEITVSNQWELTCPDEWLGFSRTEGTGSGEVIISCEENASYEERFSTLTISNGFSEKSILVKQGAGIYIQPMETEFTRPGEENEFSLEVLSNYPFEVSSSRDWISGSVTTEGETSTVTVYLEANSGSARRGNLGLSHGDYVAYINITQSELTSIGGISPPIGGKIYPNPASDILMLELEPDYKLVSVQLIDTSGRVLLNMKEQAEDAVISFDVSTFSSGIYILNAQLENVAGIMEKIIINH